MSTFDLNNFGAELQRMALEAVANIEIGVNEVASDLAAVSQKLAPLDEGGLMENATVEPAVNASGVITAKVGYNKKYALVRHEAFYNLGPTSASKPSVDGMQVGRKFLAQPITKYSQNYVDLIKSKMMGAINP